MVVQEETRTTMTAVNTEHVNHKRRLVSKMVSNHALEAFLSHEGRYFEKFGDIIGEGMNESGWSSPKNLTVECQDLAFSYYFAPFFFSLL